MSVAYILSSSQEDMHPGVHSLSELQSGYLISEKEFGVLQKDIEVLNGSILDVRNIIIFCAIISLFSICVDLYIYFTSKREKEVAISADEKEPLLSHA